MSRWRGWGKERRGEKGKKWERIGEGSGREGEEGLLYVNRGY